MMVELVYDRRKRRIEVVARKTIIAPVLKKWTDKSSSVDEEKEYRDFGGSLPAMKPGRYVYS